MEQGLLSLFYLAARASSLEEPGSLYGISWEEQETRELVFFVKEATRELERRRADGAAQSGVRTSACGAPPAKVRITRGLRVYIGADELRVRPMAKAVLLLFLRHPEGIPLKEIGAYREELQFYYKKVSRSLEPRAIEQSIDRILNCFSNDLNVNIARVNAAVRALVEQPNLYRIGGSHGGAKGIELDRALVIWE